MEPGHYLRTLRKRWVTLLVAALVGLGLGLAVTQRATPQYRSTTTVFFSLTRGATVTELSQGSALTQELVQSFATVATTPVVLDPVIRDLGLDVSAAQLAGTLSANVTLDTVLLTISATGPSARGTADVANAVATQLSRTVAQLSPTGPGDAKPITVTPVAAAQPPRSPFAPNRRRNLALGLVAGLAVGVVLAIAREVTDKRVRDDAGVRRVTALPLLGSVSFERRPRALELGAQGPYAESFRRLRTNLLSAGILSEQQGCVLVVTSCLPREGRTTTAVSLSTIMAQAGARVLLVDADMRHPAVDRLTGRSGATGLATVLAGQVGLDAALAHQTANFDVLTAGDVPPDFSELLASEAMAALLQDLRARYDLIVLDTPATLPASDAAVLTLQADGALLVVDSRAVTRQHLAQGLRVLSDVGSPVLGVVLNKVGTDPWSAAYHDRSRPWYRRGLAVGPRDPGAPSTTTDPAPTAQVIDHPADVSPPVATRRPRQVAAERPPSHSAPLASRSPATRD